MRSFSLLLGLFLIGHMLTIAQQPETKVTLGIKPGYLFSIQGKGVLVDEVIDGRAAQKAGIQDNDVITQFDDEVIKTIFDYRDLLNQYKPGDKVKVTVRRKETLLVLEAIFQ